MPATRKSNDRIRDLIISHLKDTGEWQSVENIQSVISSEFHGRMYILSPRTIGTLLANCPVVISKKMHSSTSRYADTLYCYSGVDE